MLGLQLSRQQQRSELCGQVPARVAIGRQRVSPETGGSEIVSAQFVTVFGFCAASWFRDRR